MDENEDRINTFIKVARQVLEDDHVGQPDVPRRSKATFNYPHLTSNRKGRRTKKGLALFFARSPF